MSAKRVTEFMVKLRCRRRRVFALILLSFWLLLNTQMALASHQCSMPITALPATLEHTQRMLHDDMPSPQQIAAPGLLCDKHCVPDSEQKNSQHAPSVALPSHTDLHIAEWRNEPRIQAIAWLAPPIAGPPAEIQFCRFRL
ncbi:hypothetical protein SJI19_20405 [Acerihabitans sp. TG2]|uniref:hypothetical protein n=1 Tax=Acerihabitans sp. TG2 TaxID=3096008 RepID=UPI002B227413|nr:hypothetical protein [Acerihabitans sp. TG2]MEA9392869.1 hypothetical protein [Acerihabitans sp. TG2]